MLFVEVVVVVPSRAKGLNNLLPVTVAVLYAVLNFIESFTQKSYVHKQGT